MRIGNGILVMIEEGKKERKEEGAGDALRPWLLFYLYSSIAFSHLGSLPFLPSLLRRERERAGRCFLLLLRRSYLEGAILGVWTYLYLFFFSRSRLVYLSARVWGWGIIQYMHFLLAFAGLDWEAFEEVFGRTEDG
jgi:hypothetical protein